MGKQTGRPDLRLVPLLNREQGELLCQQVRAMAHIAPEIAAEMLALIDRRTVSTSAWRFGLTGQIENRDVMLWIVEHARRRSISFKLWAHFPCHLAGNNEIMMNRGHMIEVTGAHSSHVSEALSELARIGAIERRKEGREVRWFMNAKVTTHQSGVARDNAQRVAPKLLTAPQVVPPTV